MSDQLMPKNKMLDEIDELFQRLPIYIENEMRRGRSEIAFLSELFIEELLNEIYRGKYDFKNLNFKKPNYPAIDLGDETNGISFQITVTNDRNRIKEKVNATLEKFFDHDLDQTYSKLYIFIASGFSANNNDLKKAKNIKCKSGYRQIAPALFSSENIWDFSTLYNYIVENRTDIDLKKVIEICKKVGKRPYRKIFDSLPNHISRTVSGDKETPDLIKIIKRDRVTLLKGEGGLGKTTELEHVANVLSNDGWYCGLIRLIDYATNLEDLIESNFNNWRNIPDGFNILLLLDGLDEVENSIVSRVENEITQFCRNNKHIHFLISFRNSYLFFATYTIEENNKGEFIILSLDTISDPFIRSYVETNSHNFSKLIGQLEKNNLFEICRNPFYLVNYVKIENSTGEIPLNKSDFFKKLIEIRIHKEKEKGRNVGKTVGAYERKMLLNLENLALTMQFAGRYKISNIDCQSIIDNEDVLDTSKRLVLIYQSKLFEHWRFEHNNFQEYLAAKKLSKYSWEQIQKVIFLPNKKLKPSWYNALSFLVNLLDVGSDKYKNLIDWLNENDRVAFTKIGIVHLDKKTLNQVFYSIYRYYKAKQIVFHVEFSAQELANFCRLGENQELIDFLLSELIPEMNIQNLYNIVGLFKGCEIKNSVTKDKIAKALIPYLSDVRYNTYSINPSILELLTDWKWIDELFVEKAIQNEVLIADGSIRSSFLWYLVSINYQSIPAELVLRCMKVRENDSVMTSDIFTIKEVVAVLAGQELILLLENLTLRSENDEKRRIKSDFIELTKSIEERASMLYSDYPEILECVKQFAIASIKYYKYESAQAIKPFFTKCGILLSEFIKAFENEKKESSINEMAQYSYAGYLADAECIEWIIKEYDANNIQDIDIKDLKFSMQISRNTENWRILNEKINEKTNGKFLPLPDRYTEAHQQSDILYAEALLDKKLFVYYIERAFGLYGKDELTSDEFWHEYDRDEDRYNADYIVSREILRDFIEKGKVTRKKEVLDLFSDDNYWNELQLHEHYNILGKEFLPVDNIQWIRNWCHANESLIDFQNAFAKKYDIENRNRAVCYLGFVLSIDHVTSDKDILLKMVCCISAQFKSKRKDTKTDNLKSLYEYLQEHLTNDEINDKIVENIAEGIDTDYILDEHIQILEREQLFDAVQYLPKYILNENLHKHHRIRALKTYFLLNGNIENVKDILNELQFVDEFAYDWNIIDEFAKQDKNLTSERLMDFWQNDKINKNKLAIALVKCGRIEGLNLLHQIIKERNDNSNFREFWMGSFETYVREGNFNGKETVPILTDLILVHLQPDFINDEWGNFITQLFNLLTYFFSKGNIELWADIESSVAGALYKSDNTPNYQIISRSFQSLCMNVNVQMDSECEIEDAIKKLELIL